MPSSDVVDLSDLIYEESSTYCDEVWQIVGKKCGSDCAGTATALHLSNAAVIVLVQSQSWPFVILKKHFV